MMEIFTFWLFTENVCQPVESQKLLKFWGHNPQEYIMYSSQYFHPSFYLPTYLSISLLLTTEIKVAQNNNPNFHLGLPLWLSW